MGAGRAASEPYGLKARTSWAQCTCCSRSCLELPADRLLITFHTGGIRSAGAVNLLVEYGFDAVSMSRALVGRRAAASPLTPR
ncbi:hypothetical protein GCM10022419_097590 [Nonomuraea rosea]|uniref:Rhodanese domain-containing protein n=1 Tax=Nonomuraea rosea TaxID=638574 RepID=A0ABP6Z5A8_9ACTN